VIVADKKRSGKFEKRKPKTRPKFPNLMVLIQNGNGPADEPGFLFAFRVSGISVSPSDEQLRL
jgi:hypothetical protein